ncbi:MAG TPA: hypothetical protein DEA08_20155 [Planctomycetes bacterium]|nr:hypothetical protein [Planctomycetota bacterium]
MPATGPPLPLPQDLDWGELPGDYLNRRDRTHLRWVPAGSFQLASEAGLAKERPAHRVSFERGFFLAELETTWVQ